MPANKKFIVWDWNGTLLDDAHAVLIAVNAIFAAFKRKPVSMETFRALGDRPFSKFYAAAGFSQEELDHVTKVDREIFHDHYEPHAANASLRSGAADILRHLKTHNVMSLIVSNHITDKITHLLHKHAIHPYVDTVIAYACPNTQFKDMTKGEKLHQHIKTSGLTPSNAIIIGDTVEEIEIARILGMTSVAITGGDYAEDRLRDKNPDHVIHSLHDLKPILQERGFIQ